MSLRRGMGIVIATMLNLMFVGCQSEGNFSGGGPQKESIAQLENDFAQADQLMATPLPTTPVPVTPLPTTPVPTPQVPSIQPPTTNPTVVQKGSFTAWAVPERPVRGQDYYLHILVKLPSNATNYVERDLDGMVTGTDGFRQGFGRSRGFAENYYGPIYETYPQNFQVTGTQALLKLFVPGANMPLTVDTIRVSSTLLQEQQTLYVRFGGF